MDRAFFKLRPVQPRDGKEIVQLFNTVFNQQMTLSEWRWKYRAFERGKIYGVVAENSRGNIVAHVGALPYLGKFFEQEVMFFQFVDAMVHPQWRGLDLFRKTIKYLFEVISLDFKEFFAYAFCGPDSARIGNKKGFIHHLYHIEDIYLLEPTSFSSFKYKFLTLDFDPCPDMDRLNSLWRKNQKFYKIILKRDASFTYWRYFQNPQKRYRFFWVKKLFRILGWIILYEGSKVIVVDYFLPYDSLEEVFCLIANSFKETKIWISPWIYKKMKRFIYFKKETPITFSWISFNFSLELFTSIQKHVFFTMGDVDIY